MPSVLIVEDNEELREFLVGELASSYHVLQAVDGEAGWALIQTELSDIVLTDVVMPRLDGIELTRLMKSHADLIRQYRLRKAAELLRTGYNVSETADPVGFNTSSHFTMVFREFYQQTPSEYTVNRVKTPDSFTSTGKMPQI